VAKFPGQTTLPFPFPKAGSSTPICCKEVPSNKVEIKPSFDQPHVNIDFNTIDEMIKNYAKSTVAALNIAYGNNQAVMISISVS
jgi:hypothetical protein